MEGTQLLYLGGESAALLPDGRAACRPSTGRQVPAAGSRLGPPHKKIIFICM